MALKTTIIANKKTPQSISINTPNLGLLSRFKKSVKKARFIALLVILVFSFKGNAQCTITSSINSSDLTCGVAPLSGCNGILNIGNGSTLITLTMNVALNLTCLGPINITFNKAIIDFSPGNARLYLAEGSSITFINGSNLIEATPCAASERIYIGANLFASCNGGAGADVKFETIIDMGGTGNLTSNSPVCANNTINLFATPPPNGNPYTYSFSGTGISGESPYSSSPNYSLTAPSSAGTYNYVVKMKSSLAGNPIMIREITVTVNTLPPTAPTSVSASATTICSGNSTTLSYIGGSGTTFNWYTSSCGGTYVGTGNNLSVSPNSTTTYYGRWENSCGNSSCQMRTITVTPANTVGTASSTPTLCVNTTLTNITHATTGSTGIGAALSLPAGVTATWAANVITISGTPTASGTFNYSIPLTGGCGAVNATGTITVTPANTAGVASSTPTLCINTALTNITHATTGATGIGAATGLPAGATAAWASNSITISGTPTASGTFNYSIPLTGSCGTVNATGTITVNDQNTWNGSVSTEWNNPANWSCGVPNSNSTILIPSGVTNYPLINTDGISINNIEIQNGALLNVLDNGLTITGTLTLNGKIDLQNESQLVQTSTSTVVSDCTSGKIEIDQQGSSDSYSYNYWGSPVYTDCGVTKNNISAFLKDGSFSADIKNINFGSSHTYADVEITPTQTGPAIKLSTYWIYKFANKAAGDYNSWTHIGNTGQLLAGEGFTLKGSNTDFQYQNYTFVGKPNNGLIELTVNQGMQYLIGNPYPSAIDADEFIKDNIQQYIDVNNNTYSGRRTENIIDGNLYFWDHNGFSTHLLKSYQGGYAIYNLSGEVAFQRSGIPAPPGSKTPRQFIPVAQGFFVNGLNNSGKIQFKNSQRIYQKEGIGTSEFIRTTGKNSVEKQSSEKDLTKRIYLKFNSPSGFQRQILTAFIPNTTEGIDIGYDAINNENFPEDISWVNVESTKMIIQAVPSIENKILPLEIKVASNGISKISIDQIDNISAETDILLKDNFSGLVYNLRTTAFEINLNPGTYTNRFELVLQAQKSNEINDVYFDDSSINIYLNNAENTVDIHKNNTEIKEINLYNMLGQQLQSVKKGFDNQIVKIPFNVQSGVYIVNVKTENETVSKKIIKL